MKKLSEFAVDILKQYSTECHTLPRGTNDISPFEEWLIIQLHNTYKESSLKEYQAEIVKRLQEMFVGLNIEIGRGDRLMVDGRVISGFMVDDVRNLRDYDTDIKCFSGEIKRHINKDK